MPDISRRYKDRFPLNMKMKSAVMFADRLRHSQFEHAIVEGPIERHKSRLASRETDDGLTGTYSEGSLDRTESEAKWSRERRARPGGRVAPERDKAVNSSSLIPSPYMEM